MSNAPEPPALTPETVAELARLAGHPALDAETLARIAVGATNAIRAVARSAAPGAFDREPQDFAAELERLAERR